MTEQLKLNHLQLKLRPEDFSKVLLDDIGFARMEELSEISETGEGGSKRSLQVYIKPGGSWI